MTPLTRDARHLPYYIGETRKNLLPLRSRGSAPKGRWGHVFNQLNSSLSLKADNRLLRRFMRLMRVFGFFDFGLIKSRHIRGDGFNLRIG